MPASLARPVGSQFLYLPLCPQRKFGLASTPLRLFISPVATYIGRALAEIYSSSRARGPYLPQPYLSARLGKSFPINSSFIGVISS